MLLTEWNWDDALKVCREEGWEDGWEKGIEKGIATGIEKGRRETREGFAELLSQSKTLEDLKKMFETSTQ
jgi:flagellar biosynthesis/type III secretory pathway protein FliH